jgi:hypothetical protein
MSERTGSTARVPRRVSLFSPNPQVPVGRWRSAGPQRACHHSRPEERPASDDACGDHRGLGQALDLGPLGRRPLGAQSARCRPRDHHREPPDRRGTGDRAGPDTARWVLSRHPRSSCAGHPVGCLVRSDRRWGRSRPSVGSGRGSSCFRTPPTLMTSAAEAGIGPVESPDLV